MKGWGSGLLGMIIFSGSLPATRLALGGLPPLFLTSARAAIAGLLGAAILALLRQPRPSRRDVVPLTLTAFGVVIGFPLLTALALQHITAAHSVVFVGLLPLATALFGVLRGGERPRPAFWLFSGFGSAVVAGFALRGDGHFTIEGDLTMVAAILVCGLGYAEGAVLSRRMGGWQVICWALLFAWPVMAILAVVSMPALLSAVSTPAWLGLAYVSVFSMLVGFFLWYRGLALGGIAVVGQLQLLQPFFGLALANIVLHEPVSWTMLAAASMVGLCVVGAKRFA